MIAFFGTDVLMTKPSPFDDQQPYQFSRIIFPRWQDLDAMGVLNNAVYFTLFEQARWGYFRELGLARAGRFPFVLAETRCRFLKPVLDGESLRVFAKTSRLKTRSFEMKFAVESIEKRHRTAEGDAICVYVDENLKPCAMPPAFRDPIAAYERLG